VKAIHQFVDMPSEKVEYRIPETGEVVQKKGCKPAMGHTFSSGTIDGPGLFSFEAGSKFSNNPLWNLANNVVPKPGKDQNECHEEKTILISTGEVSTRDPELSVVYRNVFVFDMIFTQFKTEYSLLEIHFTNVYQITNCM